MSDPVFFPRALRLSLADLVALTGAMVADGVDLSACVDGAAPLEEAEPGDLALFADPWRLDRLAATNATACFVAQRYAARVPAQTAALVTEQPHRAFAMALARLFPTAVRPASLFSAIGVNPGATIHPEARLEAGVVVDPGVVIGPFAEIGSGSIIAANSVVGPGVRIGRDCSIGAQTTLANALIGNGVILNPGVRIGEGGLRAGAALPLKEAVFMPQIGRVIIQDGVEIGANSTVDRGFCRDTVIGEGARIGNLVHVGADVTVGRACRILSQALICAGTGLADFVSIEGPPLRSADEPKKARQ